jgi:hypothetical protein
MNIWLIKTKAANVILTYKVYSNCWIKQINILWLNPYENHEYLKEDLLTHKLHSFFSII